MPTPVVYGPGPVIIQQPVVQQPVDNIKSLDNSGNLTVKAAVDGNIKVASINNTGNLVLGGLQLVMLN